jgi:SEC-C motif domain protein
MNPCPCGSPAEYLHCCGRCIEHGHPANTPEALMRSRYTAYTQANIDYIQHTMQGKALRGFNPLDAQQWAQHVVWLGLKVITADFSGPDQGFVEFKATFRDGTEVQSMHERSEFHRINGVWFYVDGTSQRTTVPLKKDKPQRNEPCPCGSGKKFKRCHG